jgi:hypothetical protein
MQFPSRFGDGGACAAGGLSRDLKFLPHNIMRIRPEMAPVTRDPRFDILFEPVKIGPVVAKNRFYQGPPL